MMTINAIENKAIELVSNDIVNKDYYDGDSETYYEGLVIEFEADDEHIVEVTYSVRFWFGEKDEDGYYESKHEAEVDDVKVYNEDGYGIRLNVNMNNINKGIN